MTNTIFNTPCVTFFTVRWLFDIDYLFWNLFILSSMIAPSFTFIAFCRTAEGLFSTSRLPHNSAQAVFFISRYAFIKIISSLYSHIFEAISMLQHHLINRQQLFDFFPPFSHQNSMLQSILLRHFRLNSQRL